MILPSSIVNQALEHPGVVQGRCPGHSAALKGSRGCFRVFARVLYCWEFTTFTLWRGVGTESRLQAPQAMGCHHAVSMAMKPPCCRVQT